MTVPVITVRRDSLKALRQIVHGLLFVVQVRDGADDKPLFCWVVKLKLLFGASTVINTITNVILHADFDFSHFLHFSVLLLQLDAGGVRSLEALVIVQLVCGIGSE